MVADVDFQFSEELRLPQEIVVHLIQNVPVRGRSALPFYGLQSLCFRFFLLSSLPLLEDRDHHRTHAETDHIGEEQEPTYKREQ